MDQILIQKSQLRNNPSNDPTAIIIDAFVQNASPSLIGNLDVQMQRKAIAVLEQTKNATLRQIKAKISNEEYSEENFLQDIRTKHYLRNLDRIVIKDDILFRKYFDDVINVKYYQMLLPQQLFQELLKSLHGTACKHPGILKMLQEIRQKYYYPSIAKHV